MEIDKGYSILVNSSDGFQDCWQPFFKLFTEFWPECGAQIFLNTEDIVWSYPGVDIVCTLVHKKAKVERRLTWSECLISALRQLETPLVLYLQEDYFIEQPVDHRIIEGMVARMLMDPTIKHIGLTHFGSMGPFEPTGDVRLWEVRNNAAYRISTQAGLWRTETLLSYLRPDENGWMFEYFGTRRAQKRDECFLTANRDVYCPEKTPIFQYTHTGIIKGKWHQDMPQLFARHNIEVDFEKRGFYKEPYWLIRKIGTLKKILFNPLAFMRGILSK